MKISLRNVVTNNMEHKITRTVSRDDVRVAQNNSMTLSAQHGFTSPITDKRVYIDMKLQYNSENTHNKWELKYIITLDRKTETDYSYDHIYESAQYGECFSELNRKAQERIRKYIKDEVWENHPCDLLEVYASLCERVLLENDLLTAGVTVPLMKRITQ